MFEDPLPVGQERTIFGPDERYDAKGFLRPNDTVIIDRLYWVEHFDVGNHVSILAKVLSGSMKSTIVDIRLVQNDMFLKETENASNQPAHATGKPAPGR